MSCGALVAIGLCPWCNVAVCSQCVETHRCIGRGAKTMGSAMCKSCRKPLFWRETASGKMAPFDPPEDCPACKGDGCENCKGTGTVWTSHFATCPDAARFRRE